MASSFHRIQNGVSLAAVLLMALRCGSSQSISNPSTADSAPPSVTPEETGCSSEQRESVLRAEQARVLALVPRQVDALDAAVAPGGSLAGWRLSHGLVVLQGAGAVALDNVHARDPMPQLLLYAPSAESSPEDWMDFDAADGPYTLVGWAYFTLYRAGSQPPARPCIAAREWLVHEAGFHMKDGGMLLTPGALTEPAPPAAPVHFWHPRIWDLHLWVGADGVAIVSYANPNARAGGVKLPDAAFLVYEDGELKPLGSPP